MPTLPVPQHIHRVVIIGVHGWFPGRWVSKLVGEPTGTSQRFVSQMHQAVREFYASQDGMAGADLASLGVDVTTIPLVGEGTVEERVAKLHAQLVDNAFWLQHLRDAELVMIAAHSQGSPVSSLLVSRLIDEGYVHPHRQRVCLLAMAGISHGPMPSLKGNLIVQYVEAEAARELFEFNNPSSAISRKYRYAVQNMLTHGVRITAIGSWYDQVVPLYSAVMHGFHHVNIFRGVYIEGRDYNPDFLSHLIVFALKLRNAGWTDHDLVVHLSELVMGNLWGGTQGHETIYNDLSAYRVALAWALGPTPPAHRPRSPYALPAGSASTIPPYPNTVAGYRAPARLNPYFLPWIMAQLLADPFIQQSPELAADLHQLQTEFAAWEPQSKVYRELRYRLEPFRARPHL
ncbi:hypothetical protein CXG81DRAFT_15080 [Caulochytrium protostelioides]|uniref:YMC020W-like alpha/beta hydrolase domain-containing protein n=1 Tax=Caulochytrium protostelioides TaxID=1555241 RepID=A0A4V1IU24_9FUNG|nr:hypothetical protein CXG81DRAFT_15080 [Caulochytrium protostelioides]|eukprot:RKO99067.1 hypothetical protein CXG81DRAFT_15080 [Caulochytrium protostelioides]